MALRVVPGRAEKLTSVHLFGVKHRQFSVSRSNYHLSKNIPPVTVHVKKQDGPTRKGTCHHSDPQS